MYIDNSMFSSRYLTKSVKSILMVCVGIFVVQFILYLLPGNLDVRLVRVFGLNVEGISNGWLWQFVSYALLHGTFIHLLLNMLGLFFLGPELERSMGTRSFTAMFIFCSILGGIGWYALTYPYEGVCVGASGGIFGLIGAFAGLFPNRQLTLLVFFVLPVTMPAWLLAVLFGLMQLAYLLNPGASSIAYAAHLAGGIAGFIFVKVIYQRPEGWKLGLSKIQSRKVQNASPTSDEINSILDKVSNEGIHSLTPRERSLLQKASRR